MVFTSFRFQQIYQRFFFLAVSHCLGWASFSLCAFAHVFTWRSCSPFQTLNCYKNENNASFNWFKHRLFVLLMKIVIDSRVSLLLVCSVTLFIRQQGMVKLNIEHFLVISFSQFQMSMVQEKAMWFFSFVRAINWKAMERRMNFSGFCFLGGSIVSMTSGSM